MIIAAILEKNLNQINSTISRVAHFCEKIHLDVVNEIDLHNIEAHQKSFEVHFMVEILLPMVNKATFADTLIFQNEHPDLEAAIKIAKDLKKRVGISLSPNQTTKELRVRPREVDFVQFMTVVPGEQGRPFEDHVLDQIKAFAQEYPDIEIQVDGGINTSTILKAKAAGASIFVVGSAILGAEDPKAAFKNLQELVKKDTMASMIDSILPTTPHAQCVKFSTNITKIGFLGGAAWKDTDQPYIDAYDTAKLLAQNGYEIFNGGGPGVMQASTLGAQAGGGKAVAITYHPNKPKRHYEGVDPLNTFDTEVRTLDYFDRTKVMLQTTDIHIVFNGSLGTMSELAMTWISSWIHEPNNKPIILFGDFWHKYINYLKEDMLLTHGEERIIKICNTPEEVLEYINSLCK